MSSTSRWIPLEAATLYINRSYGHEHKVEAFQPVAEMCVVSEPAIRRLGTALTP
jgi:hypothetical protein